MQLDLCEYESSFVCDGAVVLFKDEPDIATIERLEHLLKEVANDAIRKKLERSE
jgi:hypothetical protein